MGNVKAVPVVGETVTAIESGVKITAAGIVAPFDSEQAGKLAKGAGDAWVEYSEKNIIAGPINSGIRKLAGDDEGAERVIKSTGRAVEGVLDSTPVVGHVKGVVHYAMGDEEHGDQCMIGATRTTAVLGVGALTGGVGGGFVAGGMAGVGTGVAYDGVHSVVDSEVHNERRTHGIWNIDRDFKACKDANDVANAELAIAGALVGDFMAGGGAAEATKNAMKANKIKQQRNDLKNAFKEKAPEVDQNVATKETIQAARNLDKHVKDGTVKRDGHVSTRVRNSKTGETHQGYSSRARGDMNVAEFEKAQTQGKPTRFDSKTQAKKTPQTSKLMEQHPEVKPQMKNPPKKNGQPPKVEFRNQATCAKHDAFNKFYENAKPGSAQTCAETFSVMFKKGVYTTVVRCKNCLAYAKAMGKVATDKVGNMTVPVAHITPYVTTACKCGALAVGAAIHLKAQRDA